MGNLTPVPAIPAAAAVLLRAVLARLGGVRRRRVATSGSLVLAGVLAVPAAGSAEYWAAKAARTADSTALQAPEPREPENLEGLEERARRDPKLERPDDRLDCRAPDPNGSGSAATIRTVSTLR